MRGFEGLPEREAKAAWVRSEQIYLLFRNHAIVLGVNALNGSIVAIVLYRETPSTAIIAWLLALLAMTSVRFLLWRHYRSDARSTERVGTLSLLATAGSAASGLLWGGGAAMVFPDSIVAEVFLTFVVGGMMAGATVTLPAHMPALYAFILPCAAPMIWRFSIQESVVFPAMTAMFVVYSASLLIIGRSLSNALTSMLGIQFDKDRLLVNLTATVEARRRTEEQLHQSQKMQAVGQLTSGLAHDFNNYLTILLGNLDRLQHRLLAQPAEHRLVAEAIKAAIRCERLTHQLLAFARKQRLDPEPLRIADVLQGMDDLLRRTAGPSIVLDVRLVPDLPAAHADRNQLETAILNLMLNARDALPQGGSISITARTLDLSADRRHPVPDVPAGRYVVLSLADTGGGMSDDILSRAFEPFFTTKEVGRGTGLGLSMVYGFARQSGGDVEIESAVGRGTTVRLYLPTVPQGAAAATAVARDGRPG